MRASGSNNKRNKKASTAEIELDLGRYELRRGGRAMRLARKPMELLIFLVTRRDQLVTREEIVSKLWRSDLFVDTESNVNNIVRKIRTALGDDSAEPRFLETVIGKGYRFVGPVKVIQARQSPFAETEAGRTARGPASEERTSLAILPLSVGGNAADRGLGLGFADALISRMGNLPGLDVLPTQAVLQTSSDEGAAEVAAKLGVRFVVRGALQSSKGRWQLSVEMMDAHAKRTCFERKSELDLNELSAQQDEIAKQIAGALNQRLAPTSAAGLPRHSKDPLAYAEFMQGYQLSQSGDAPHLEEATHRLDNAVARDPAFSLAHATLSVVCATRHFEFDPARMWLEKAEFHCARALELDPNLAEGHVAKAFLLWGPAKNFQHLDAIAALKRALALQKNLPHAYNRLGTILAHVGLLDLARTMYEQGRVFHPRRAISHSIVQVQVWSGEYDLAEKEIEAWRAESPGNKYPTYFAPQVAMLKGNWKNAKKLLDEALRSVPGDPMIVSLQGLLFAMTGKKTAALKCMAEACASPRSFGHAHHTYYQVAGILSVLGKLDTATEWLERSVSAGFACWPFFLRDPALEKLRQTAEFEALVATLRAKYRDNLGLS
jgi:DNA-binding winged helix-turn-helix (wHTH) protein/tetratricopeptide (TPR) repeat protein